MSEICPRCGKPGAMRATEQIDDVPVRTYLAPCWTCHLEIVMGVPHGFRTVPAPTLEMIPNEPLLRGEMPSRESGPTGGGSDT